MNKHLRSLAAAAAALAAGLLTSVVVATPASAVTATTCSAPSISGSLTSYTNRSAYGLLFSGAGHTTANCSGTLWKYTVEVRSGGTGSVIMNSTGNSVSRAGGTTVSFSDYWMSAPTGQGHVWLIVKAYYKSGAFWISPDSYEQDFILTVPNSSFDTADDNSMTYEQGGACQDPTHSYGSHVWC